MRYDFRLPVVKYGVVRDTKAFKCDDRGGEVAAPEDNMAAANSCSFFRAVCANEEAGWTEFLKLSK